jgi:hypothetical protein
LKLNKSGNVLKGLTDGMKNQIFGSERKRRKTVAREAMFEKVDRGIGKTGEFRNNTVRGKWTIGIGAKVEDCEIGRGGTEIIENVIILGESGIAVGIKMVKTL